MTVVSVSIFYWFGWEDLEHSLHARPTEVNLSYPSMTTAPHMNIAQDLTRTYGQALVGLSVATGFWGATCLQTLMYFENYPSDAWVLKGLVIILWALDTVHEILCVTALWQTLVPKFGDLENILMFQPDFMWQIIIACIVAFIARSFFIWRIWRFTEKNWIFPVMLLIPSIGDTTGTFIWALKGAGKPAWYIGTPGMSKIFLTSSIFVAATDILIAATMCFILWKGRTGSPGPDRLILRLMTASVNTGSWTAILGVFCVITTVGWPDDLFSLIGQLPLCPLYCNAVLGNLNSRNYMKNVNVGDVFHALPGTSPSIQFGTLPSSSFETRGGAHEDQRHPLHDLSKTQTHHDR